MSLHLIRTNTWISAIMRKQNPVCVFIVEATTNSQNPYSELVARIKLSSLSSCVKYLCQDLGIIPAEYTAYPASTV